MADSTISLKDLLPFATAVVGYFVGAARTAIANTRERRKALNSLLHVLLQIRFELKKSNPRFLHIAIGISFERKFGSEATAFLGQAGIFDILSNSLAETTDQRLTNLFDRYRVAVDALVPMEPFLAYLLTGEHLISIQPVFRDYYNAIRRRPDIMNDPNGPQVLALLERKTLDLALDEVMNQLTADIMRVARADWTFNRFRAKKVLSRQDALPEEALDSKFDAAISDIQKQVALSMQGSRVP